MNTLELVPLGPVIPVIVHPARGRRGAAGACAAGRRRAGCWRSRCARRWRWSACARLPRRCPRPSSAPAPSARWRTRRPRSTPAAASASAPATATTSAAPAGHRPAAAARRGHRQRGDGGQRRRLSLPEVLSGQRGRRHPDAQGAGRARLPTWSSAPPAASRCETAPQFLALPNVKVCGGSWLTPQEAVDAQDWARITALARAARRCALRREIAPAAHQRRHARASPARWPAGQAGSDAGAGRGRCGSG